jgi:hypothetical protein
MNRSVGLDVGTGFITSATKGDEPKKVKFRKLKDCFFKVDPKEFGGGIAPQLGEKMLKKTGAHFIKVDDMIFILGDSAFKLASTVRKQTLRPMKKGVLNPQENLSSLMVEELIKAVAKEPESENDNLVFCVPAKPIDADYDIDFHTQMIEKILKKLGYKNISHIDEGLALVYSEASDEDFTAMGISFGSGMVNLSFSFMGMSVLSFSISRGGDWIDENAAKSVNENPTSMQRIKENGIDICNPKNRNEEAIAIHYKVLLKYLVNKITDMFNEKKSELPDLYSPITIYVAGGTSLAGGFIETLESIIKDKPDFPIPIEKIKHAEEPLFSVSNGLFQLAKLQSDD